MFEYLNGCSAFTLKFGSGRTFRMLLTVYVCSGTVSGNVRVSMLASRAIDRGFEPQLGQTKDYKISICCFSAKHAALREWATTGMLGIKNNVSERGDMSTRRLLFQ